MKRILLSILLLSTVTLAQDTFPKVEVRDIPKADYERLHAAQVELEDITDKIKDEFGQHVYTDGLTTVSGCDRYNKTVDIQGSQVIITTTYQCLCCFKTRPKP